MSTRPTELLHLDKADSKLIKEEAWIRATCAQKEFPSSLPHALERLIYLNIFKMFLKFLFTYLSPLYAHHGAQTQP